MLTTLSGLAKWTNGKWLSTHPTDIMNILSCLLDKINTPAVFQTLVNDILDMLNRFVLVYL